MSALQQWLNDRTPEAPSALRARIGELMSQHPEWELMPRPEALLHAGELLMTHVLAAAPRDRDAARDLLAADACVTYALEAAADEPPEFAALAERAMRRIAALASST